MQWGTINLNLRGRTYLRVRLRICHTLLPQPIVNTSKLIISPCVLAISKNFALAKIRINIYSQSITLLKW